MRITLIAALALVMPLAGCNIFSSKSSGSGPAATPVAKVEPGIDFGIFPQDYQLRVVEAFQAKWPADVVYKYRFEMPRRVQNTYSKHYGYVVRFAAQKVTVGAPLPSELPWEAYFENGKVVWVQRGTEAGDTFKWFDSAQGTVDWPPVAPAQ